MEYLRSHPCVDCGEGDVLILELDHVRGSKVKEVGKIALSGAALETVQKEIDKCESRCPNCHRRKTLLERKDDWRTKALGLTS